MSENYNYCLVVKLKICDCCLREIPRNEEIYTLFFTFDFCSLLCFVRGQKIIASLEKPVEQWYSTFSNVGISLKTLCYQLQYTGELCFNVHEKTSLLDKLMFKKTYVKTFPASLANLVLLDAFRNLYSDKVFTDVEYYNKIAHAIVPTMVTFLQNKN